MMSPLDDILAPLGAAAFLADHAGRRPAHLVGVPGRLELPGWPELAELLNMSALWSAETLVVLENGEPVAPERYCESGTDRDMQPTQRPIAERVLALQADGAVVVARHIETLSAPLRRIAAALESGLGARVAGDLHIRRGASPAPSAVLALSDVIVLLLAGGLGVRVGTGTVDHPVQHPKFAGAPRAGVASEPMPQPLLAARLAPGERLYVPRGCVYEIDSLADDTAFVVLAITRPVGLDLLHALAEVALDEPFFRVDLARDGADRQAYLAEFGRQVAALAASAKGAATLVQVEHGFQRDLAEFELPKGGPSAGARYRRNASRLEVVETPRGWQLRAARGAVPIPPGRERLVAWIVARAEFSDDELRAAFPEAAAELVASLLNELAAMKVIAPAA